MCDKAYSENPFMLKYCFDWYKNQEICDKAVDNFLWTFFPHCLLYLFIHRWWYTLFYEGLGNMTFLIDEMGILSVDINNINLDDANFDEDDPRIIIHVRLMAYHKRLKQHKAFKKEISKEWIPVAWHPTRW